jgi:hypothetical protein
VVFNGDVEERARVLRITADVTFDTLQISVCGIPPDLFETAYGVTMASFIRDG